MTYHLICEYNETLLCDIHLETPFLKTQREEIMCVCHKHFSENGCFCKG